MTFAISPRFTLEKLASGKLDDMIDVFEDQMLGWLIDPANQLKPHQHAGFAILAVVLSYFEPIGQFLTGEEGSSKKQFGRGLREVFPGLNAAVTDEVVNELYDQLRCGMFHRGITKGKVLIAPDGDHALALRWASDGSIMHIVVVPRNLMYHLEQHLERYLGALREPSNTELRKNFERWFRERAA
jgi:hypothetical protein